VISKELDRARLPVAVVSAMYPIAEQVGASRIVKGVSIPHPCGDPSLPPELDRQLRRQIVAKALEALETPVEVSTVFTPDTATSA
jgi:glycine reductase complex component B subunit gamma